MNRREELIKIIGDNQLLIPFVDEVIFLEERLAELKKLPFIKVNPNNTLQQKVTPAQKAYKELLQQYTNAIKVLSHAAGIDEADEESPLRKWLNERMSKSAN